MDSKTRRNIQLTWMVCIFFLILGVISLATGTAWLGVVGLVVGIALVGVALQMRSKALGGGSPPPA